MNTPLDTLIAMADHYEIRILLSHGTTEVQAWTHPRISDRHQTLCAQASNSEIELAALDVLDQIADQWSTVQ